MDYQKIALYGGGAIAVVLLLAVVKARAQANAPSADDSSGVVFSQPSMMYGPSGSGSQVTADATSALPDVPASVSNTAPATAGSTFDLGGMINNLLTGQKELQTVRNEGIRAVSDTSLLGSLGITSGSVTHSANGTIIQSQSTAVPSKLQQDYDKYFLTAQTGASTQWGGGVITKNADSSATFKKSDGSTVTIRATDSPTTLAQADADIARQWRVQYGFQG